MKTFKTRIFVTIIIALFISSSAIAGSAISFTKFDKIFGYKSKYSVKKKDKLIKKLNGKKVEWEGKLKGKFFHFSKVSLSLDMGKFTGPRNVNVTLKSSQRKKLKEINKGSIVKIRGIVDGYGKVKFHNLIDGVILKYKQGKNTKKDFDARDIRFNHWNKKE